MSKPKSPPNSNSFLLPTPEFNHLLEIAMIQAREHLESSKLTGYIPVCYLMNFEPPNKKNAVMAIMPDFDIDHRYKYLAEFGAQCVERNYLVMAFVMVSEAWRTTGPEWGKDRPMPKDDPKRIECITAVGQTVDGRTAMSFMDVTRDKHKIMLPGKIEHSPWRDEDPFEAQSDLCAAFWKGYQRALRDQIMGDPTGRAMVNQLKKKDAAGSKPAAGNFKLN